MNKNELVTRIAEESGLTKRDSELALDAFVKVVKEAVKNGEEITLQGFVKFGTKVSKPRPTRNPSTGESLGMSEEKTVPTVKISDKFKNMVVEANK